jgi:L-Ala-D/L-Glu epimerase
MKLVGFNIFEISIPFHNQFKHALAARNKSSSVVFEIIADNGMNGYGEGSPREYVTGESIEATIKALRFVSEKLKNKTIDLSYNIVDTIRNIQIELQEILVFSPSATCAIELALLDMFGKSLSKSALSFLGDQQTMEVFYSGVVTDSEYDNISQSLDKIKAININSAKIKAGRDFNADSEKFKYIRSYLEADVELRVDANGAWNLEEAIERIEFYSKFGVTIFEQPMPVALKQYYPVLLERIDDKNQIIVDESVCTYDDGLWFVENNGANGINLKISKHGGLINTLSIHQLSVDNGFNNQLGCHVGETSILTSAGVVFSALTRDLIAYEGAYGGFLLQFDLIDEPIQFGRNGKLDIKGLNDQKGLGIEINTTLLDSASINSYQL